MQESFLRQRNTQLISRMFTNRLLSRENTSNIYFQIRLLKRISRLPKRNKETTGSYLKKFIRDLSHIALLDRGQGHAFEDFEMKIITSGSRGCNKFAGAPCSRMPMEFAGRRLVLHFLYFRRSNLFSFFLSLSPFPSHSPLPLRGPPQTHNLPV